MTTKHLTTNFTPTSAVSDWDETLKWTTAYNSEIFTDTTPYHRNYLHALHSFDNGDFSGTARHLENVKYLRAIARFLSVFVNKNKKTVLYVHKTKLPLFQVPGGKINNITEELTRKGGVRINHLTLELDVPGTADPAKLLYLSQLQLLRVCGLYHNGGDMQVSCL